MNYEVFQQCFESLCLSFDLDPEKKKNRCESYFSSKLGEISEINFLDVIKKAKETLTVKPGSLPPVRELIRLYYNIAERVQKSRHIDKESFSQAICAICGGTGRVSLEKEGCIYGGFCCTCIIGQKKNLETFIGQQLGFFTEAMARGFNLPEGVKLPKEIPGIPI